MEYAFFAVFGALGAGVGITELLLLKKLLFSVTAGKYAGVPLVLFAKLAVYAAAIAVTMIFFTDYLIALGAGFGAGMVIGAVIVFLKEAKKQK